MPKQVINYPSYAPEHPLGLALGLHWSEGDQPKGGPQMSVQFNVDDLYELLKRLRKDSPTDKRSIVFTEPLGRHELNRLVATARRARNAEFGADE